MLKHLVDDSILTWPKFCINHHSKSSIFEKYHLFSEEFRPVEIAHRELTTFMFLRLRIVVERNNHDAINVCIAICGWLSDLSNDFFYLSRGTKTLCPWTDQTISLGQLNIYIYIYMYVWLVYILDLLTTFYNLCILCWIFLRGNLKLDSNHRYLKILNLQKNASHSKFLIMSSFHIVYNSHIKVIDSFNKL